jgi:2-amino-4-hydroxy-6-hydroxymethyldihydropteridine diphosphokinase
MARVYVGIGSNTERETRIREAVHELRKRFGEVQISPVYDSEAVGFDGSNFLNLVAGFDTSLDAETVVSAFHLIEDALGRDRSQPKFSSRPIDLDILLYDDMILEVPGIRIPRPEILESAFVLKPLQDIAGHHLHPQTGQSYSSHWQSMASTAPRLDVVVLNL